MQQTSLIPMSYAMVEESLEGSCTSYDTST